MTKAYPKIFPPYIPSVGVASLDIRRYMTTTPMEPPSPDKMNRDPPSAPPSPPSAYLASAELDDSAPAAPPAAPPDAPPAAPAAAAPASSAAHAAARPLERLVSSSQGESSDEVQEVGPRPNLSPRPKPPCLRVSLSRKPQP